MLAAFLQDPEASKSILDVLLDNVLALTIAFIFASAILGAFLRQRSRDKCLKDFHKYHVTVEETDGDAAWGRIKVYSTGFELVYDSEHKDLDGHVETSYVVYEKEYGNLYALYRHHDQLTPANQKRRLAQIRKTYQPSLGRWLWRKLRNFFNTLRDAFVKSIETLIGSAKKTSKVMKTGGGDVSKMGKEVIGHFGNAYDPILERFVGKRVVVEIVKDGKTHEYPGILKEYTAKFLEVLAVRLTGATAVPLDGGKPPVPDVEVRREGPRVILKNVGREVVNVRKVVGKDYEQEIGAVASPGAEVDFNLKEEQVSKPKVIVQIIRDFDMVVPRAHALIRHAGKREKVDWKRFVLGGARPEVQKDIPSS
ncbi:MAG: hypothetical protein ACYTAF_07500 [Planctomycetota bacterium]